MDRGRRHIHRERNGEPGFYGQWQDLLLHQWPMDRRRQGVLRAACGLHVRPDHVDGDQRLFDEKYFV